MHVDVWTGIAGPYVEVQDWTQPPDNDGYTTQAAKGLWGPDTAMLGWKVGRVGVGDDYMWRGEAIFRADAAGMYEFSVVGDDTAMLIVGEFGEAMCPNPLLRGPKGEGRFDVFPTQTVRAHLGYQEMVRLEARLKEAGGGDYVNTQVKLPSGEKLSPIPMIMLVPNPTYTSPIAGQIIAGTHIEAQNSFHDVNVTPTTRYMIHDWAPPPLTVTALEFKDTHDQHTYVHGVLTMTIPGGLDALRYPLQAEPGAHLAQAGGTHVRIYWAGDTLPNRTYLFAEVPRVPTDDIFGDELPTVEEMKPPRLQASPLRRGFHRARPDWRR
jgi:hypothetical protein